MVGAEATSPALPSLALPAHPAPPCHALPHPTPGQGRSPAPPACPHVPQRRAQDLLPPGKAGSAPGRAEAGLLVTPQCWEQNKVGGI